MTRPRRPDLHDLIRELTEPTQHRELYERRKKTRYHVTKNPPLLTQLEQAAHPTSGHHDDTTDIAGSRPAANLDAIDTHNRIHYQAHTWLHHLGRNTTGTTIDLIRRLGSIATFIDTPTRRAIETDMRHWRSRARIITGWDTPPWRPANTCPLCTARGTLRIRFIDKLAMCINDTCNGTWDEATIGLLADHIRTENGEHQTAV